jgi:septum formation protein
MPQAQPTTNSASRRAAPPAAETPSLILASASPQRTAILTQLGIAHTVVVADVDEVMTGDPEVVAEDNARAKAHAVAQHHPGATVIGSDTIVVTSDGEILGKPADLAGAYTMLARLVGRTHVVVSGLAIAGPGGVEMRSAVDRTTVRMRALDDAAIARHLAYGEWQGRAGAYAIQGRGAGLVERIEGDYLNVVGLPVALMSQLAPQLLDGGSPRG